MSLFQCESCGCAENTACSDQGFMLVTIYDWSGLEELKGKQLCCVCGPTKLSSGKSSGYNNEWHNYFPRIFLPKGQFVTSDIGNLAHIDNGDEDYRKYAIRIDQCP